MCQLLFVCHLPIPPRQPPVRHACNHATALPCKIRFAIRPVTCLPCSTNHSPGQPECRAYTSGMARSDELATAEAQLPAALARPLLLPLP